MINTVYIGLGSNLNDPVAQIQQALARLNKLSSTQIIQTSSLYQSPPWGPIQNQPVYINAVTKVLTVLGPAELLNEILIIEKSQGRYRMERWGPRSIDLDILLYNDEIINQANLSVPHPRLCEREFVVYPLLEIEPALKLPDGRRLSDVALILKDVHLVKLVA